MAIIITILFGLTLAQYNTISFHNKFFTTGKYEDLLGAGILLTCIAVSIIFNLDYSPMWITTYTAMVISTLYTVHDTTFEIKNGFQYYKLSFFLEVKLGKYYAMALKIAITGIFFILLAIIFEYNL